MPDHHYPEHEKLSEVSDKSQAIGEFLDWVADEKGWRLAEWEDNRDVMTPVYYSVNEVLAEFFGIDYKKLMAEKDDMLAVMRGSR